jgi:hypothetical protein
MRISLFIMFFACFSAFGQTNDIIYVNGDGTTDNTTAIQTAITNCSLNCKVILMNTVVDSQVMLLSLNITFKGNSVLCAGNPCFYRTSTSGTVNNRITFEGLAFTRATLE